MAWTRATGIERLSSFVKPADVADLHHNAGRQDRPSPGIVRIVSAGAASRSVAIARASGLSWAVSVQDGIVRSRPWRSAAGTPVVVALFVSGVEGARGPAT